MTVITTESSRENINRFPELNGLRHPMDQAEISNWTVIAEKMEASGDTESWFYLRARAIADGKQDPMPTVSELMPKSA
ncbi:enoyl-CoA hydratase [Synechococcus sp. AH-551-B05]|nr:enoyl-CoA hydratase [Synechococcus sp. AH-551-B05]MDB4677210.1 enoyl-CoA hydratase [Synechococcus sp. AH-551-B05]